MPKIFKIDYNKIARKNWASPQDAGVWFKSNQDLLLWMANESKDGKKLLRLDQTNLQRVDKIGMNRLTQHEFVREGLWKPRYQRVSTTDFRVGAKWANLINYQWDWFSELAREYYAKASEARVVHSGLWNPVAVWPGFAYGTTSTFYPDPDVETTTVDGSASRTGVDEAFATIIAGSGNASQDATADTNVFSVNASSTSNQYATILRSFFLFDTSGISDTDIISAAVLSLVGSFKNDTYSPAQTPNFDIYTATPASNTAIVDADYSQVGSVSQTGAPVAYSSLTNDSSTYVDFTFNATGRGNVSKTGVSKFSGRNANYDAAAVAPTWSASAVGRWNILYADQALQTADPKLVVTHAAAEAAAVTIQNLLLMGIG